MEKVIKNGEVAVLISHGFGAGWYTWNPNEQLLFHPKLVEMVDKGRAHEITQEWVSENLGIDGVYCGGVDNLEIHWLPIGTTFSINEYDGSEFIVLLTDLYLTA